MLQETNIPFPGTSWHWLTEPETIEANELIDPFDLAIYTVIPAVNAQAGPTVSPSGDVFEPDGSDDAVFDALHRRVLPLVIGGLPDNNRIVAGDTRNLVPDAEAEMADGDDLADAEAAIGVNALAGTGGVSPCVAVLARAPVGNRWRVGCIHLSASDMESRQLAADAIDRLLAALAAASPDANTGPVELYVVGGCEDANVAYEEFARVIAAAQLRAAAQGVVPVRLAGALVPACAGQRYVDVYIGANGVTYSVNAAAPR